MTPSADDYTQLAEDYVLGLNFCATLVQGMTPESVIDRLGGSDPVRLAGVHRLERAADGVTHLADAGADGTFNADRITGLVFVAVTQVDDWVLIAEPNGHLCINDAISRSLSRGTTLVSHYHNENADSRFVWARDGDILLDFDPFGTGAGWRAGSDPDSVLDVMHRLGFELGGDTFDPDDPRHRNDEQYQQRAFALAEHLTGVRLTAELLQTATFLSAAVPEPSAMEWITADPAHTAPYSPAELAAQVRHDLAAYAASPDDDRKSDGYDEADWWAAVDVPDARIRATGPYGASLASVDMDLLLALAHADDDTHREVTRWAHEWAFATAELTDQPWFTPVLADRPPGAELPPVLLHEVAQHLDPLPMGADHGPDGRLDRGVRQHLALEILQNPTDPDPLRAACEALACASAIDAGRHARLVADLRRAFPRLATSES